ncbi:hypothetical protein THAOC_11611 [Thalassiosira oceanica]|uniref:Uncharacterized protein n=1 Tax=Thalassiosira oceanica TaxID=159749 RepID=K0TA03_THAOC|nr:hypothetical protein THAOC_11611 [Thalassiosira oceanica]|eukprot:EJK67367.1 hypothetical protein THAOC_11611 [Thalassiosira oceanica]
MHTMDATDIERGLATELVCISEIDKDSDEDAHAFIESNFADDNVTVATGESTDKETTNKSALVRRKARKSYARRTSFVRMKSIPSFRSQKRGSSSESVHSSSEETSHDDFLLMDRKKKTGVEAADKWWKFETICADDLLSEIFLTIARCSAFFDYPLCESLRLCRVYGSYFFTDGR